jgi:hypothetical protein
MVRSLTIVPVMLCAAAIVAAQTPAPDRPAPQNPPSTQQPAQPSTPAQPSAAANKVTYTGCLKEGTAANEWLLENAEAKVVASAGQAGAGGAAVGTSGAMKTTFKLNTKPSTDLKPHADHKIEVVGTLARPSAGAAAGGAAAGKIDRQELTVESVKMASATCP